MRLSLGICLIIAISGCIWGCYSTGPVEGADIEPPPWLEGSETVPDFGPLACPVAYYALELPSLYGRATEAVALNNSGQIVGEIHAGEDFSTQAEPVLWSLDGRHPDRANIELIDQGEDWFGFAPQDVNDHGEVVGGAYFTPDAEEFTDLPIRGIFWSDETGILELDPSMDRPVVSINNNGTMVAHARRLTPSGHRTVCYREFSIWSDSFEETHGVCLLDSEDSGSFNSFSAHLNNADSVAGHMTEEGGMTQPYRWRSDDSVEPFSLGDYDQVTVTDLNDQDQMVGSVRKQLQSPRAVIWDEDNQMQGVEVAPGWTEVASSAASAINNLGLVVGVAWGGSNTRAWLRCENKTVDLAKLVIDGDQRHFVSVDDINDDNWIIAHERVSTARGEGILKAMVLIPFESNGDAVE